MCVCAVCLVYVYMWHILAQRTKEDVGYLLLLSFLFPYDGAPFEPLLYWKPTSHCNLPDFASYSARLTGKYEHTDLIRNIYPLSFFLSLSKKKKTVDNQESAKVQEMWVLGIWT